VFQLLILFASFAFYTVSDKKLAQRLFLWSGFPPGTDRTRLSYVGCLVGAYGLASTNFVIAPIIFMANGTIDVWVSGNAI
jgi:hypothetical protein